MVIKEHVYPKIAKPRKKAIKKLEKELPENLMFLKRAVTVLFENQQRYQPLDEIQALVDHFLSRKKRNEFYKILPENIRDRLLTN
jgi:hypothetical protein